VGSFGEVRRRHQRGAGNAHFFWPSTLAGWCDPQERDQEEPEVVTLSRRQIEDALTAGEFKGWPGVAAVTLALRALDRRAGD